MKKIVLKYPTGTDAASTSFKKEMAPKKKLLKNLKVLIFFLGGGLLLMFCRYLNISYFIQMDKSVNS